MNGMQNNELKPLMVSIQCTAYNHEEFIRETLEGFVMQKANFRFEAIVHDDASIDGTAEIIREYAEKYPDIIKPIYEVENQYSKKDGSLDRIMYKACKGKYIAICEGDDYWTDPYKLQKQVDFLEAHTDYVMCSHRYIEFNQESKKFADYISPCEMNGCVLGLKYDLKFLVRGGWLAHPLTCMYRRSAYNLYALEKYKIVTDAVLFFYILKTGYGLCMSDEMAVYRIHDNGIWSGIEENKKRLFEFNRRIDIYKIERSYDAAVYLLSQFTKTMSRVFVLKHLFLFMKVMHILCVNFGIFFSAKLFLKKMFLGKNIQLDKMKYVSEVK